MVYKYFTRWLSSYTFFPGRCISCGADSFRHKDLCLDCERQLPWQTHACMSCALPLTDYSTAACGECQRRTPSYDRVYAPFQYQFPINQLINQFKHHDNQACGKVLSELFCQWMNTQLKHDTCSIKRPDYLIAVPLHWSRLWKRGFNQASWLTHYLSNYFTIPCLPHAILRVRAKTPQQTLSRRARLLNLRDTYQIPTHIKPLIAEKHVTLVDDVMTTGSTVETLAQLLKQAGARQVTVWVLARTPKVNR